MEIKNLSFSYGEQKILNDINFIAEKGGITAVIGANGVGKSTLLKCIAGLLKYDGEVLIDNRERGTISQSERAKIIGYLGQNSICNANLSVFEVVLMGLVNELSFHVGDEEIERVNDILRIMNIEKYAQRKISKLSGGQQQLVFIAQTLIKKPKILIMDEPTSALDLNRQFSLMEMIKDFSEKNGTTTLVCHHHLDLVSRFAKKVVVLSGGRLYCEDSPQNAFNEKMFKDVYSMNVELYTDSEGIRHMVPVNRV